MQKTREEIGSSVKAGFGSMMMLVLSVACFIVFLWVIMAIVRLIAAVTL